MTAAADAGYVASNQRHLARLPRCCVDCGRALFVRVAHAYPGEPARIERAWPSDPRSPAPRCAGEHLPSA